MTAWSPVQLVRRPRGEPGGSPWVFGIYAGGRRVGRKYLEREHAERDARALRGTYVGARRRPTIRVRRIRDR